MKKIEIILLAFLLLFSIHKIKAQNIYSGKLSTNELINLKFYLKKNIATDLDSVSVLVINYMQPISYCHYSKYNGKIKNEATWFEEYFKKNNIQFPENYKFTNIYYEEIGKKKFSPKINHYFDENHFFHNLISTKNDSKSCECFLVVDKNGEIIIKYGETSPSEIKDFLKPFER